MARRLGSRALPRSLSRELLPLSATMWAWWTSRSMSAAATIASERIFAQAFKAAVGRDDDRAAFVAAGDQREEQVGGLAFQWQVADLVDDQQAVALQPAQFII